ncbi:glycosyltransferase family 4 protein [Nocardioides insulae]|uniref:glycosyltransferase family 4 protein n=1 Tax=Nocardioides insulae TaxID=394734 RepID=UPI000421C548|nr:glycosyltransferase family 4 protein [Nocardioides insulae]
MSLAAPRPEPTAEPAPATAPVLIGAPSCDVYGSDLQLLQTVAGLRERGLPVVVVAPEDGPLRGRLEALGVSVRLLPTPVLRRGDATPAGLLRLGGRSVTGLRLARRLIRETGAGVVCANTVTVPGWLAAARSMGVPSLCHVHEAEAQDARWVRRALAAPLRLADTVVVNSRTTRETLLEVAPALAGRTRLIHNGVEPPPGPVAPPVRRPGAPYRLVVVGRISARKAPHVAVAATALLRAQGREVELELCGTPGPGQEEYDARLRARAERPDLRGTIRFAGYTAPVWPALERADAVVATSLGESFGNVVVEGQLACRPVIATAVQGHLETVRDGHTGLLVPTLDPAALAGAVARLMDDGELAERLARTGRERGLADFGVDRYRQRVGEVIDELR